MATKRQRQADKARKDLEIRDWITKSLGTFIKDRPDSEFQAGYMEAILEMARTFGAEQGTYVMAHALASYVRPTLADRE